MLTKRLYQSFKYAFAGLWFCIKNERNFRIHIVAAATVFLAAPYYHFTVTQMLLLTIAVALVIICEMLNTALEASIDLACCEYKELAKIAKDVSAGAVLISALCSVVFGFFLFFRINIIHNIISDILKSPLLVAGLLAYISAGYLFVRGFDKK
ncbi:MAG: Undecaprenol kinase [Firmicutes bacterium ADurb.Bin193]|nr:MAG: Undecaprenol kinase [Firmicutes bacterium ADurb.Bin193]